jgi:hypothetical protein
MADKRRHGQRSKEIWYETTRDKRERKGRYPPVLKRDGKMVNETLTWIIILLLVVIGLMVLWFTLQV